ncbi:hypothetical protein AGMMS49545_03690 [Betaproteobacteria bacterium]|nr:hypothetical protein AGMMS49545_03690 [Betaproteobacteria bacterium]GHU41737.1 hypothetical protein AGMMS50289_05370 [Betaproteobacteria bacterium]
MKIFLPLLSMLLLCLNTPLFAAELKAGDHVLFIPGIAYDADGEQRAEVSAFVYEKEQMPGISRLFAAYLGVDLDELPPEQKERYDWRTGLFRADFKSGREFSVEFSDGSLHAMPETEDGKSTAIFKLAPQGKPQTKIPFAVHTPPYPESDSKSFVIYAAPEGVSIILDIDDTIKVSNVRDKKALLLNTFFNDYTPTAGIKALFAAFTQLENPAFHYVSASPAHFYPALAEFFAREQFPEGSFHLRDATDLRDLAPSRKKVIAHKTLAIEKLFAAYPGRKFILVGDSGESDPEIYATIKRKFPDRVLEIYIRNVTDEDADSPRFQKTYKGILEGLRIF